MVNTRVEAGICGFVTEIEASSEDMQHVSLNILILNLKITEIS